MSARLALGWLIAGEWRWHPARFLLTAVAIAVGVALGFAVHLVNGSALAAFEGAVRGVNGAADLAVAARSRLGFDEALYPRIATAPGVADASPVVRLDARIGETRIPLLGLDMIRAAVVTPSLVGASAGDALDEDALFLSRAALARTAAKPGERVAVFAGGRRISLRIAGPLPAVGEEEMLGVLDIAAAQWRFGRLRRLDRIDLRLADEPAARAALARLLPADAALASAEAQAAQGNALSRAYRVNLDMLALVALLTGGFLVFSAQSLSVTRRMRAFALVRTLGLPRGGIVAAVALEGVLIGLVGAGVGLALGYALAAGAFALFGGDLGAGYFAGAGKRLVFQPAAAAAFFALGLAAAVLGSALPARAAARAAPAAALRNAGDVADPRAPAPWRLALLLIISGACAAFLPPIGGLPLLAFVSMALLLAGGVAGVPWLARKLLFPLSQAGSARVPVMLAVRHVQGAPREAATALCGIVASTALMIAMATMVTSFRGAVDQWLGQVLAADLYLRTTGDADLDRAAQAALRATPGVASVAFSRPLTLSIASDRPPLTVIARDAPADGRDPLLVLIESTPVVGRPVWVSEPAARIYGWRVGQAIDLPLGRGGRFAVAGVWRDYARQAGALVIRGPDYEALTGDTTRAEAAVTLAPGADARAVGRALRARLPADLRDRIDLAEPATLRRFALGLFDRSFAVTYVLEVVAILIGLAGVAATISAQTIARAKEFGMLRHLGLHRREITAMLGVEGAILGAVGGVAGVLLGLGLAQVLIHVVNPQSFHWTMATRVPLATLLGVIVALVVAAAGTAVLAGRRATATDSLLAVREDW